MTSAELRKIFLDYFASKGHTIVPSSSLVPGNDPTLLFTNAGMVQFKDVFLGVDQRPYVRASSAQRCVRAGGKHNDLENVGYTARHHTFFEMLGNFSFGDYFKREAVQYAWEFLTQILKLPPEKLWVTVYEDDHETADIWLKEMKIDPTRFSRCGAKDNFWSMGDTGPCGPCTEIFYDHGPEVAGGPPGTPEEDGDRYIEIWNLVFMQFDRSAEGELITLPKPSVDTGMGLERVAAVMQNVHNNYDIDLFQSLIRAIAAMAQISDLTNTSLRVIADHIRSVAFLIVDGVIPSNEGRGYVLRRIIRRAIRHGNKLGLTEPFFHRLVAPLVSEMGAAYAELAKAQSRIEQTILQEEQQFARTLEQGMKILEQDITHLTGKLIAGATVFKLYDTYGFPVDLTADIARERGLTLDLPAFEQEMAKQRQKSQEASKFGSEYHGQLKIDYETNFVGYERLEQEACVVALYREGEPVKTLSTGEAGWVVLDHTPFYAESGGQVGDQGMLRSNGAVFRVTDTRREGQATVHIGQLVSGALSVGVAAMAQVDMAKRQATALNHSATHLLHAALRQLLGEQVVQRGSLVAPDRLRFDFTYKEPLTVQQLGAVERLVNEQIRANYPVETHLMSADDALASGAMALFGEKYGNTVRVLHMGEFSAELCGGTHAKRTGDIGLFKIMSESGIAAGIRRIEAVTGEGALDWVDKLEGGLREAAQLLKASRDTVLDKLQQTLERGRTLEKRVEQLQGKLASSMGADLAAQAMEFAGIKILVAELQGAEVNVLRDTVDQLKSQLKTAVIVLASVTDGRVNLIAGVTKDCVNRVRAGDLVNHVAMMVGGKGGGRPDLAQAGGNRPEALQAALKDAEKWIQESLHEKIA